MMDSQKQIAFEKFHAKECNCDYNELKRRLDHQEKVMGHRYIPSSSRHEAWLVWNAAWQAAQAVPEGFGDIQSWIAVNSFSALDASIVDFPVVDANELAEFIDSLNIDVAVPEGFVLVPVDQLNQWGHMANYAEQYGCPECFEARGYAHTLTCEINEYFAIGAQEPTND